MVTIKVWYSKLILVSCILLTTCAATPQQKPIKDVPANPVTSLQSKRELAKQVLKEVGVSERYNLYLANVTDMAIPPHVQSSQFREWLRGVLVQEAGWAKVESQYIARLEATYSEAELKELVDLAKQPIMKKLLQTEIQAYTDTAEKRRELLSQVWDDYNAGKLNIPPGIVK